MATISYFDDQGRYRCHALLDESFVIGRVESCHVALVDDLVSREHARIDRDPDGRFRIRDLGSRNKTHVNGQQISETLLTNGDMIRIGHALFEFLDGTGLNGEVGDMSFLTPDRVDPPDTQWVKMAEPVSLPATRLAAISMLTSDGGYPARTDEILSAGLGRLMALMQAERGFVALRGESKRELRLVAQRGFDKSAGGGVTPVSETFALSAMLQSVGGRYPTTGKFDAKQGFAAAGLVAPIWQQKSPVGVVYVDRPTNPKAFTEQEVSEMIAAGAHLGVAMTEASERLSRNSIAASANWLATVRRLQLAMTAPPATSTTFDVSVKLQAGRIRCGDFCDVMPDGKDRLYLLLTDAGGHGVAGMAQGYGIRSAIRTALTLEGERPHPARLMSSVNRTLGTRSARQLVLCSLVCLDLDEGKISYINAGCPPPLLLTGPGRLVTLDQPALVLGIDAQYEYEVTQVDLPSAFRLICHSDGLCDLTNAAGEVWGTQGIHDLLLEPDAFATPVEVNTKLTEAADRHRSGKGFDDDALIVSVSHG